MSDINAIRTAKFVSGEMFDLTAASFNNDFGAEHNQCVIKHGINFPLSKFIKELSMITEGTTDDKTSKRQDRLDFLNLCESSNEVRELFSLFTNYLNGGGTESTSTYWAMQQYYNNFIVITAAGGNIITLFAHLLVNMIDIFICKVNADFDANDEGEDEGEYEGEEEGEEEGEYEGEEEGEYEGEEEGEYEGEEEGEEEGEDEGETYDGCDTDSWNINNFNYRNIRFKNRKANDIADTMFSKTFATWPTNYWDIINNTFESLTRTNKILLEGFERINKKFSKEQLCFIIVKYFIKNHSLLKNVWTVAESKISDFDFKLSPNIHPSLSGDPEADSVSILSSLMSTIGRGPVRSLITKLISNINPSDSAGFLLFRVKTLIDCSEDYKKSKDFKQKYTTIELKNLQRDCVQYLDKKAWCLYPQIIQKSHFHGVPRDSDCWKFLNYLYQKKEAIQEATQFSIDETMKFHMAGYFKQTNSFGEEFAMVNPAKNSTEAIIDYISNNTHNMNMYIENWETVNPEGEHIWSSSAAPGLHEGGLPANFSHESVCFNFLSLDSILNEDNGLIARLSADIINYFLNMPDFNTEQILDNLIKNFKKKREQLTKKKSNCFMPPADLLAVPTSKKFNESLRNIKEILDGTRYSDLGYPDGIRITLNAIKTEDKIGDTQLDTIENTAHQSVAHQSVSDPLIKCGYTSLSKLSTRLPLQSSRSAKGLNKKLIVKKSKTKRKQKKQKPKSLKLKEQKKPKSLKLKEQKKPKSLKL